jgi:hypothetical protein
MLHLLKEKSRFYHFLKSRYMQNKKCRKTFVTPGIPAGLPNKRLLSFLDNESTTYFDQLCEFVSS